MNEQEREYILTESQDRLLSIAGWAKNLAWVTLVIYVILAISVIFQDITFHKRLQATSTIFGSTETYWEAVLTEPVYNFIYIGSAMLSEVLKGIISYVVLKGISLGLYMIVETDINYTDKERQRNIK